MIPKLPVFDDFLEEEIQELFDTDGILLNYQKGEFIIRQGEAGSALFVLLKARLE